MHRVSYIKMSVAILNCLFYTEIALALYSVDISKEQYFP